MPEIVILLAGTVLRLAWLGADSLWYDECFSSVIVSLPLPQAWSAMLHDVHPPGWYAVTWIFTAALGDTSEAAMRLPAALCSIGALFLFAWWLRQLDVPRNGQLVALALMAFAPQQIRYAAEARMYAALSVAALLIIAGVTLRRPWLLAGGVALAPWLHHLGWLYVAAAMVAAYQQRRSMLAILAGAMAAAPAGLIALYQVATGVGQAYWIQDHSVAAWLYNAVFAQVWGEAIISERLAWHAGLLALALATAGLVYAVRQRRQPSLALAILAWLPGLLLLLISQARPLLMARPLIGTAPAIYALAGLGLAAVLKSERRLVLAGLLVAPLLGVALHGYAINGVRMSMQPLLDEAADCGRVTHTGVGTLIMARHYAPDQEHLLWEQANSGLDTAISPGTEAGMGIQRVPLQGAECVVYSDHVLVDDTERTALDDWLKHHPPVYTLVDDDLKKISLHQ